MRTCLAAAAFAALSAVSPALAAEPLSSFGQFHVPAVETRLDLNVRRIDVRGAGDRPVSDSDARDQAEALHERLVDALADRGALVEEPGPGVLTVAVTLTDLRSSRPTIADIQRQPGLSFDSVYAGGAAFEAAFSVDGEPLGDMADDYYGSFADNLPRIGIWQDAEDGYRFFARKIVRHIEAN